MNISKTPIYRLGFSINHKQKEKKRLALKYLREKVARPIVLRTRRVAQVRYYLANFLQPSFHQSHQLLK